MDSFFFFFFSPFREQGKQPSTPMAAVKIQQRLSQCKHLLCEAETCIFVIFHCRLDPLIIWAGFPKASLISRYAEETHFTDPNTQFTT